MYWEFLLEMYQFFCFMQDVKFMDLEICFGKVIGGYCIFIDGYKVFFIFFNFNGISGDIDVLIYEVGYVFQVYSSWDQGIGEYVWLIIEVCEIYFMSMEFFIWLWMEFFFKVDIEKYKFGYFVGVIYFLFYGVVVDEFQYFVYENLDIMLEECNVGWWWIEQKYLL